MEFKLEDKKSLVLGGSSGIGLAIARRLSDRGSEVILVSSNAEKLEKAKSTFKADAKVGLHLCNLMDRHEVSEFCNMLSTENSEFDILINNSGGPRVGNIFDVGIDDWDRAIQANFLSFVQLTRYCLDSMKQKGWGRVINISSTVAIEPSEQMVLSASVRSAVSAFSKSVADTVAKDGISINTICPGGIETERLASLIEQQAIKSGREYEETLKDNVKIIPAGRYGTPDELASFAEYLCCEEAVYITGRVLGFDGGLLRSF